MNSTGSSGSLTPVVPQADLARVSVASQNSNNSDNNPASLDKIEPTKSPMARIAQTAAYIGSLAAAVTIGRYSSEIWSGVKDAAQAVGDFFGGLESPSAPAIGASTGFFIGGAALVVNGLFLTARSTNTGMNAQFKGVDQFLANIQYTAEGQFALKADAKPEDNNAVAYNKYGTLLGKMGMGRMTNAKLLTKINTLAGESSLHLTEPRVASFNTLKDVVSSDMRTSQRLKSAKAFASYVAGGSLIGVAAGGAGIGIGALSGVIGGLTHIITSEAALAAKLNTISNRVETLQHQSPIDAIINTGLESIAAQNKTLRSAIGSVNPRSTAQDITRVQELCTQLEESFEKLNRDPEEVLSDAQRAKIETAETTVHKEISAAFQDMFEPLNIETIQSLKPEPLAQFIQNLESLMNCAVRFPIQGQNTLVLNGLLARVDEFLAVNTGHLASDEVKIQLQELQGKAIDKKAL